MKYRVVTRSRGGYEIQRWKSWIHTWVPNEGSYYTRKDDAINVAEKLADPKTIEVVWESK